MDINYHTKKNLRNKLRRPNCFFYKKLKLFYKVPILFDQPSMNRNLVSG